MKKIILALLILAVLILSGCKNDVTGGTIICNKPYMLAGDDCCLDKNDNSICDRDEIEEEAQQETAEPPKEEPVAEPEPEPEEIEAEAEEIIEETEETEVEEEQVTIQSSEEYTLKTDNPVTFEKKTVTIKEIDLFQGLRVVVDVDGIAREIYNTQNTEIINGLKIQIIEYQRLEGSVTIKIEHFELGTDEYLIDTRTPLKLFGKEIKIRDIFDDGAILFDVTEGDNFDSKLELEEGESLTVQGITITNVDSFPSSGIKVQRYAVIKVQR